MVLPNEPTKGVSLRYLSGGEKLTARAFPSHEG